jgi:hypothetical protein
MSLERIVLCFNAFASIFIIAIPGMGERTLLDPGLKWELRLAKRQLKNTAETRCARSRHFHPALLLPSLHQTWIRLYRKERKGHGAI